MVVQYRLDRPGVVTLNPDQLAQGLPAQAVALNKKPIVRVGAVRCWVCVEWITALPRLHQLINHHWLKLTNNGFFPHQAWLFTDDRPFDDGSRERHEVVDKRRKRFGEPTFDELIFHLQLHPASGFLRQLFHLDHHA